MTLVYSDLFDYPLTAEELHRDLVVPCDDPGRCTAALAEMVGDGTVECDGDFYCLAGRGAIVPLRAARRRRAARRWRQARRFARWLARVPFVRMVAVCGSQAVDNATRDADVDLFLVTAPGRLWLAQSATMVLRRLARLAIGIEPCPNYLLSEDRLEVAPHTLYTAREVAQVVPLWGAATAQRFFAANRWIGRFLPQRRPGGRPEQLRDTPPGRLKTALETLLGGAAGARLDRLVYGLLVRYYARRLRRPRAEIELAYRRERQVVVTGGYLGAVAERFAIRAGEVLGDGGRAAAEAIFAGGWEAGDGGDGAPAGADPLYAELFARRYGGGR
ncbi:MAG: hypothetical protein D6696_19425 [Acidobacteria bacterium]|nr:MAG: hypothetical protein D6696_19425 [Acidobacteriota bacterium]